MKLTLIQSSVMHSVALPEKMSGQYFVPYTDPSGRTEKLISVVPQDGYWTVNCGLKSYICTDGVSDNVKNYRIDGATRSISVCVRQTMETVTLLFEDDSPENLVFHKYVLNGDISIGTAENDDIRFKAGSVKEHAADIKYHGEWFEYIERDPSACTFINGIRTKQKTLEPGDLISIMGFSIIVGKGILALNNIGNTEINGTALDKFYYPEKNDEPIVKYFDEGKQNRYFSISPRFMHEMQPLDISIEEPPQGSDKNRRPAVLQLGSSFTMGVASAVTAGFTVINAVSEGKELSSVLPSIVMAGSMMMSSMVWPVIARAYEAAHDRKVDKDTKTMYIHYLESLKTRINEEMAKQEEALRSDFPPLDVIADIAATRTERLWERLPEHSDFLEICLGTGDVQAEGTINFPKPKLETYTNILRNEMENFRDKPRVIQNAPIVISLKDDRVIGIIGSLDNRAAMVHSIVMQITVMHNYKDVKLAVIYDPEEHEHWDHMRWFPHAWNAQHNARYIAENAEELQVVAADLEQALNRTLPDNEEAETSEHYVVICTSYELYQKTSLINHIISSDKSSNFSVVLAFEDVKMLPKECSAVITVGDNSEIHYIAGDKVNKFVMSDAGSVDFRQNAVSLANITLNTAEDRFKLPNVLTFLEMFGVNRIEELNCLNRWRESNPMMTLAAPIGVDTHGNTFGLDLHQRMHGPHGLIAGTTGSGKSEFIMTLILSLAVNYSPDEVSFLLIDYKGGGMAEAFKNLPHIAGIVTNLSGAAINRSLISIESELKRRQRVFLETSEKFRTTINDIYTYQGLCREDPSLTKMQHLFIISDEFAELKNQQQDFMDKLISAARIGRSLGVHLILATQKPSGVVNPQIWSNSRFKVCLKVQDREDSTEVIRCPDAAEITQTGRFYLQVGYNEVFELGQSAWCGADYDPEVNSGSRGEEIAVIDNTGRVISRTGLKTDKQKSMGKQVNLITRYITETAAAEKLYADKLWLAPLAEEIYQNDLKEKYPTEGEFKATVGEYDIPEEQRQDILRVTAEDGNILLCGSEGSGKTSFLTAYIFDFVTNVPASRSVFYILDFSSGTLKAFEDYNAVGAVITVYQSEKLRNLMCWLQKELSVRQEKISDYGGFSEYIKKNDDIPAITVVISNYGAFRENYEDHESVIEMLSKDGKKFGIFFIISDISPTFIKYKVLQNFRQHFTMQLDDGGYSSVVGRTNGKTPTLCRGRGLTDTVGEVVCEFQTAFVSKGEVFDHVRLKKDEVNAKYPEKAFKIKTLPEIYTPSEAAAYRKRETPWLAPLALETSFAEPEYIDLSARIIPILYSSRISPTVIQAQTEYYADNFRTVMIDAKNEFLEKEGLEYISGKACFSKVCELFDELTVRHKTIKSAVTAGSELPGYERIICVINGLDALENVIKDIAVETNPKDVQSYVEEQLRILERLLLGSVYDCKMTFVIIDRAVSLYHSIDKEWFKRYVKLNSFLWIGKDLGTEETFRHEKISNKAELADDMGYCVFKGKCKPVKFMNCVED